MHLSVDVTTHPELVNAITPLAKPFRLVGCLVAAFAVLPPVAPLSSIAAAVGPGELTVAHLLVIAVFAKVAASIGPGEGALALHPVGDPFAFIASTVRPSVYASAVKIIVEVLTDVSAAVGPSEAADAVLATHDEAALVFAAVRPGLNAETMLTVLIPLANVLRPIIMFKGTPALRHVAHPVARVALAGRVNEASVSVHLVGLPVSFVLAAVAPDLDAAALSLTVDVPLACIVATIIKLDWAFLDEDLLVCVFDRVVDEPAEASLQLLGLHRAKVRHLVCRAPLLCPAAEVSRHGTAPRTV